MSNATSQTAATQLIDVKGTSFAYRELGKPGGTPLVLLHHLTATLDDWDPAILDGLAAGHHVIAFDNRGVGRSGGTTPDSVIAMADDAVAFIEAKGLAQVDLLGYSLGGLIAQRIASAYPKLVRRLVLAGTGPAAGEGLGDVGAVVAEAMQTAGKEGKHPKSLLFFAPTSSSQTAGNEFLGRLSKRTQDNDVAITNEAIQAQVKSVIVFGHPSSAGTVSYDAIVHPVLVVNGKKDIMIPTPNSIALYEKLANAQLVLYPDSGHGAIFQFASSFVEQTTRFLQ